MNRRSWLPLAVVMLVMAFAATAQADDIALIGGRYQNVRNGQITDANGNVYTLEASKGRDLVLSQQILGPTRLSTAMPVDSMGAPLDVHAYSNLKLLFSLIPRDSTLGVTKFRFAVQIREHYAAGTDTLRTFYEELQAPRYSSAIGAVDTLVVGNVKSGSSNIVPWDGEFIVVADPNRMATANRALYSVPYQFAIPLDRYYGTGHRFNKITVRIRLLASGTSGANTNGSCTASVYLLGFAL